jgi:indolepyruvate ferredoxin oxidoreductase
LAQDRTISLETLYNAEAGPAFMTGIQALVRLPLMQRRLDRRRGLKTAGLISGYRGSPLGAYDQQLWRAQDFLDAHDVLFQPGLNEDLAATALWGAQMHKAYGPSNVDGIFGIWYGKGNGVDRTGDVFRNANMLGTSALGGVLAIAGDDHSAQSSMFPHQTDGIFESVHIPVLQPANVEEILTLGMAGIAMSRFTGTWVAMKTIAEVVESAGSFDLPSPYPTFASPADLVPRHGLNWDPHIEWPAQRAEYERRMVEERLPAIIGWATANGIDRPILRAQHHKIVIVTVGKAHQDLMQALETLGIGEDEAEALGLSIYKVGMSWPLATKPLLTFVKGASEILVIEEKAPTVENQIKAAIVNLNSSRPIVTGKRTEQEAMLLPVISEFNPLIVAQAVVSRIRRFSAIDFDARLARLEAKAVSRSALPFPARKPFFCSGCPHNTSTKTPAGSISGGGIGCHVMALSQPKLKTPTFSHMGGEGLQWVGAAPFSQTEHIFQNLGDGTYQHSGLLAIRAAVAAGTNITYKILFNDAVAMTGGQPTEGAPDPIGIVAQLIAEGVRSVHLVSDEPERWSKSNLPGLTKLHHRDELNQLQEELRSVSGVTAIVYEQTCAAEKRRRRKRGAHPDPDLRIFINQRVCEGCGDCSVQSNCISIEPVATRFGTKRKINQSACNKDFSCTKGFCPSFVEIEGAELAKPDQSHVRSFEDIHFAAIPEPEIVALDRPYNIYVAGIGGLGVLTAGTLLGSAAHLGGLSASVLDFTGLAQKNGAVVSQVRIAPPGSHIHAVRIGANETDLLLGADALVAGSADALEKFGNGRAAVVLNIDEAPTADIVDDRDFTLPSAEIRETLLARAGTGFPLKASRIAEGLFGNTVAANTLIIGYAWQKGLLPFSSLAFEQAIEANGAAIELNKRAFAWGRLAAVDLKLVEHVAGIRTADLPLDLPLDELIKANIAELTAYQDTRYAARYERMIAGARVAAADLGSKGQDFVRAVATYGFKLLAYKDEYEVARLYCDPAFRQALEAQFSRTGKLHLYLAPPLISRIDKTTGRPAKRKFGPWIFYFFSLLSKFRGLRGTWADPFGRTSERRNERRLASEYTELIEALSQDLCSASIDRALELAQLPDIIRGFGPVKEEAMARYEERRATLLEVPEMRAREKAA